jgi:tRNA(Ile2) C34 agmatinyltransferase TiaS
VIYVGLDDTDRPDAPGTNQLAKALAEELADRYRCIFLLRHQLLQDERVACTRHNSAAALCLVPRREQEHHTLVALLRSAIQRRAAVGSNPGFCLTSVVPQAVRAFGRRCQSQVVRQAEARQLASTCSLHLEGLGGTEDGIIGAVAAVGLAASGSDGRIVLIEGRDDLTGVQPVDQLRARGVQCRCLDSGRVIGQGCVDVGKHLRPNYRQHKAVLFVQPASGNCASPDLWNAVRLP